MLERVQFPSSTEPATIGTDPSSHSLKLVDEEHFEEMRTLLGELRTAQQIDRFLSEVDELVTEIARLGAAGENERPIRASLHRVAGSAAILGAQALREHLQRLEASLAAHQEDAALDAEALQRVAFATGSALRRIQVRITPPEQT